MLYITQIGRNLTLSRIILQEKKMEKWIYEKGLETLEVNVYENVTAHITHSL